MLFTLRLRLTGIAPLLFPKSSFGLLFLGHYQIIDELDPKLRRSIATERNYFDYRIGDGQGNIDGRLGIKLGLPGVEVIEEFQPLVSESKLKPQSNRFPDTKPKPDKPQIMNQASNSTNSASAGSITIPSFFQSRLSTIVDKLGISPDQAIQALFTWTEMGLSLAEQLDVGELTPGAIFESVPSIHEVISL